MQLILWRHAQAEDGRAGHGDLRQRDLARELTNKGEKDARKAAEWLRPRLPSGTLVLTSPAVRTVQTVQQLTAYFERVEALAPDTEPSEVLAAAGWPGQPRPGSPPSGSAADPAASLPTSVPNAAGAAAPRAVSPPCPAVVVVGHQPTLGRIASLLLTGQDRGFSFGKSAVWWFAASGEDDPGRPALRAVFDPALG